MAAMGRRTIWMAIICTAAALPGCVAGEPEDDRHAVYMDGSGSLASVVAGENLPSSGYSSTNISMFVQYSHAQDCNDCVSRVEDATGDEALVDDEGAWRAEIEDDGDVSMMTGMPSQDQCIGACKGGTSSIEAFCRILPDPRLRAGCWGVRFAGLVACIGWCAWNFY